MSTEQEVSKSDMIKETKKKLAEFIKKRNRNPECFFTNYFAKYYREKLVRQMME